MRSSAASLNWSTICPTISPVVSARVVLHPRTNLAHPTTAKWGDGPLRTDGQLQPCLQIQHRFGRPSAATHGLDLSLPGSTPPKSKEAASHAVQAAYNRCSGRG